jgi:hypothetical protein
VSAVRCLDMSGLRDLGHKLMASVRVSLASFYAHRAAECCTAIFREARMSIWTDSPADDHDRICLPFGEKWPHGATLSLCDPARPLTAERCEAIDRLTPRAV